MDAVSPVGLMADSHGRPDIIQAALVFFRQQGCRPIFHLGDICDSFKPETAAACVKVMTAEAIDAVKGNNDHQLVVNRNGNSADPGMDDVFSYLADLPLIRHHEKGVLTHSLPLERQWGMAATMRSLGEDEARMSLDAYPDRLIFRGHSHSPELVWRRQGRIVWERIQPGEEILLENRHPCIVTCGALTRGLCMIWHPEKDMVKSLRFQSSGAVLV